MQPKSSAQRESCRTAIIVGASLSGLMTALALARTGVRVTLLERSDDTGRTGAAIGIQNGLLERITGLSSDKVPQPLAPGVQTWFAAHGALRASVDADPFITLRQNTRVAQVGQDSHAAWAVTVDNEHIRADMVIGADGHRSIVRRHVAPDKPDATFAGYLIWIGIADESAIPARRWPTGLAYEGGDEYTLLGYPLPGEDGSTLPGHRRLGWALYDSTRNELLKRTGSVDGPVVRHSLLPASIPAATYADLDRVAASRFSRPWSDAIRDSVARRSVIGTPIAEYVPTRLVAGRVALVGDAAHVPTPMTGSGFSESLYDAEALATAIVAEAEIPAALLDYERLRLRDAQSLVTSGQAFSLSFAGQHTA